VVASTQGDRNVWLYDIARRTSTRLTFEGRSLAAIWSPDGAWITFGSSLGGQENIFQKAADGGGTAERITESPEQQRVSSWSPDGQTLLFVQGGSPAGNGRDILLLTPTDGGPPQPLFATRFDEMYAEFSPDGRWIAYASNESGLSEVYVAPYPGRGSKVLLSVDGGHSPVWARNGRELLYLEPVGEEGAGPYNVMAVSVTIGERFSAGQPRKLFATPLGLAAQARGYDLSADGTRLLMVQPRPRTPLTPSQIVLVQNWHEELKRRVPSN
jgi:Tol biopolymer transport system component